MIMKFIVVCFLLIVPTSFGLSGLLEMSQVLWTKLLNGGLSNIGPLDPLNVPVVKVDQSQGRTNYRMVLSNIEILGLNDSSLESIHVGRGSVKSNLSENEAGYVSYNDRNAIDFIRYRFHTVVKEPNDNQSHSEDLTVEPLEKYANADVGGEDKKGSGMKSDRYQGSHERHTVGDDDGGYGLNRQRERQDQFSQRSQQHQYQQNQGRDDFAPRGELNQRQEDQNRHNDDDNDRQYGAMHQDRNQNPHYQPFHQVQHQHSPIQDDSMRYRESSRHQGNQNRNNENVNGNNGYVNIHQEGQRVQYQRPQHQYQHRHHQHDPEVHRETFASQESTRRPFKQGKYDANNYEKHQQIPRIEGFKSSSGSRHFDDAHRNENNNERSYLVYAQTGSVGNGENGRNHQSDQSSRGNYERMPSNDGTSKGVEVQQMDRAVDIQYPARFSHGHRPCDDVKDDSKIEMISQGRSHAHTSYQGPSARLEDQPSYVDIIYADDNSKKMRHFGNVRVEQKGDETVYSLEDMKKDLENHRRFIVHNFTESEFLSKKNDKVRTAEETKRIKDMIRYAKEFQENQGFFEEGMELTYHYGNGSEAKVYDGKRMKREHAVENENDDDIMHVIIKIRVPLLKVKADYVLLGKVGDQVMRGNGQLSGNFTELIGDFTVELKKSNNNTLVVRAARAKLVAEDQDIKLEGMDENEAITEILTQGLMAAEAVAAMLADDLATKALNESTADAIIYKMYKELPPN